MTDLQQMGQQAKQASRRMAVLPTEKKNEALQAIAEQLEKQTSVILEVNAQDLEDARANGASEAILDRLALNEERVQSLADDTRRIINLPDPVGAVIDQRTLPNGIELSRRRIPIGVLGVIYEARPNVTIDISTLCLKSGNVAILRGGSETRRSNMALVQVLQDAMQQVGLPETSFQYITNPDRQLVTDLLKLDKYVDMIVPRGGAGLHRLCKEESTIPVITGGIGICHVYVDETADIDRAVDIVENAKVQRPSVCNALDTLLVHESVANSLLPKISERLSKSAVELHAEGDALKILQSANNNSNLVAAGPDDFDTEWLALKMGVKIVHNLDEAINHIQDHGTEHSDSILTNNQGHADTFVRAINSAAVYVNASTRFTDGGEFGLGAEVAVSTQKLHARGPMGLEELTTYKWIGIGAGQIRE